MSKSKLEYIWLDGYEPTQSLRSKTKIVDDFSGAIADAPIWAFDGSSTEQASGDASDCQLKPVACFPDPDRFGGNGFLVMCEVLNADEEDEVEVEEKEVAEAESRWLAPLDLSVAGAASNMFSFSFSF